MFLCRIDLKDDHHWRSYAKVLQEKCFKNNVLLVDDLTLWKQNWMVMERKIHIFYQKSKMATSAGKSLIIIMIINGKCYNIFFLETTNVIEWSLYYNPIILYKGVQFFQVSGEDIQVLKMWNLLNFIWKLGKNNII